ncbi:MAG: PHP domain-containing protein [Nocardioidaceae bacterium]
MRQDEQMDGIAALSEIAYWMERERAESRRVEAYRKAAWALAALPAGELQERIAGESLTEVATVGKSTSAVVMEASRGVTPKKLLDLRQRGAAPLAEGGEELRSALRGDLHSHSNWSDGGSPIPEMVEAARRVGHEYLALTDHSPRLTIARGLSVERLTEQLGVIAHVNEGYDDFRLLPAIEVDILEDGGLDQTPTDARPARRRGGKRPLEAARRLRNDDLADGERYREPVHQRARPLHRAARRGRPGNAAGIAVRRRRRVCRMQAIRRGRGDQFTS